MAFTLEVRFFGLSHFVSNSNPVGPGGVGACVVFPDAARHTSKVEVRDGALTDASGTHSEIRLGGKLVDFQLQGGAGGTVQFTPSSGGVDAMVQFGKVLGSLALVDPDIVKPNPPAKVRDQILLRGGALSPRLPGDHYPWKLPKSPFKNADEEVRVAAKSVWSIRVDGAKLSVAPFGRQPDVFDLNPSGNNRVVLEISNECHGMPTTIDHDFMYHFAMLAPASRAQMERVLGGPLDLPRLMPLLPVQLFTQQDVLLSLQQSIDTEGDKREIARFQRALARINMKFTSGGNPTGCNCLPCNGGGADIQLP